MGAEQPIVPDQAYTGWAIVELMGHRQRAGRISQAEMYGTRLLRIDIPCGAGEEPYELAVTEYYGGAAIYALRPCSEAVARALIARLDDPRPVSPVDFMQRQLPLHGRRKEEPYDDD